MTTRFCVLALCCNGFRTDSFERVRAIYVLPERMYSYTSQGAPCPIQQFEFEEKKRKYHHLITALARGRRFGKSLSQPALLWSQVLTSNVLVQDDETIFFTATVQLHPKVTAAARR